MTLRPVLEQLLDEGHTNELWVTWLFHRIGRWLGPATAALLLGTTLYVVFLAARAVWRRRRKALDGGRHALGWYGLREETVAAAGTLRARWKLGVGAACLVGLVKVVTTPFYEWSYEYSTTCGRFRKCASVLWGHRKSCSLTPRTRPSVKSFATERECDAGWQSFLVDVHSLDGSAGSGGSWTAIPAKEMVDFYETELEIRAKRGVYAVGKEAHRIMGAGYLNNSPDTCNGYQTAITETTLQLATAVSDHDGGGCWVLNENGELRYYPPDRVSRR